MQSDQRIEKDTSSGYSFKIPAPWIFIAELVLAMLIIAIVIVSAIWPFLSVANDQYPNTIDAMGHLTKIKYVADCFINREWPAWFPYMDNGSMALQYGSPFSRILLAPIQILTDNIMITYKIGIFLAQFIGGLGVWYTCRRFIGPWVGILGGVLYAVQPILLMALLNMGEAAQIPMFAITPWFLCFSLLFFEQMTPGRWLLICISGALMILTHAMSAFLICIGLGVIIVVLFVRRNISIKTCFLWVMAMALAAGIEAFWGVPSLTHLEHPLMPYTLPELAAGGCAVTNLFNPAYRQGHLYYAGCVVFLFALGSIIQFKKSKWVLPLLIAMVISIYLSFGPKLPLYEYIPLSDNFIPRKFLNFTVLAAVILDVFFIKELFSRFRSSKYLGKVFYLTLITCITILLFIDINPRMTINHYPDSFTNVRQGLDQISVSSEPFEQGRFAPLFAFPSWYFYFAMTEGLNSTHGNSTSTPYTGTNIQHSIAVASSCPDYIVKNLLLWNTRYVYLFYGYNQLYNDLIQHGFQEISKSAQKITLINPTPSSYFMRQERNAIAIGKAASPLAITFPWLVQGHLDSLEDYSAQYLDKFSLVYLIEPDVKDFKKFQKMVFDLLDSGKTVIVSMGNTKVWPLAGIAPYWESIPSGARLIPTDNSPYKESMVLEPDPNGQAPAMGNLDEVWMEMQVGDKRIPAIGYKNVNGHRLYFVGICLDKQLNPHMRWARGYQGDPEHSKKIADVIEQVMDIGQPNKNFVPISFPVSDTVWGNNSFSFKYKSEEPVSLLASVTYSLHWKGKLDDSPLAVQQLENLILVDLPAGEHQVSFHYGMTWVGWLGIGVSVLSLLFVVFICCKFDYIDKFFCYLQSGMKKAAKSIGA